MPTTGDAGSRADVGLAPGAGRVSVVVPAFDAEAYLAEALDSALAQTLAPREVVVIDDGSTDATAEIAQAYGEPVRCISQPHGGIGAAVNRGIGESRGALLAFLDADDVWTPAKLALQVRALEQNPALDFVLGHVQQFHSPELTREQRARTAVTGELEAGYLKGAMLIRREAFERAGPFATRFAAGDFVEWYARALDAGLRSALLPELVLRRRIHMRNTGARDPGSAQDYARALKTVIDRRRAAGRG